MKKITITMALLFAVTIFVSAQNKELDKWAKKENAQSSQNVTESRRRPNVVREAGFYLEKSAKYQYAAIGCAGVGTTLTIISALIGTKDASGYTEDKIKKDRNLRNGLYIASGACIITGICLEFASINYKMKAGRSLRFIL